MTARVAIALAALAMTGAIAQQPDNLPQRPTTRIVNLQDAQAADAPEPPEPPPGANSWSLRIHTSGGFTGQGIGSVTITSNGQMACGPAPCATPIAAPMLQPVTATIASILESHWIRRTPSGICRDCILTTIALKRREGDVVRVYRASWDDSQPPSAELRELRRLAFELRAARAAR